MICLYRFFDQSGKLLYVGISRDFLGRMKAHVSSKKWFYEVTKITIERLDDMQTARRLEAAAILAERPVFNVQKPKSARRRTPGNAALSKYLSEFGIHQSALADKCGVSQTLVSYWITGNRQVSPRQALNIEKATGGVLSRRELLPELFA